MKIIWILLASIFMFPADLCAKDTGKELTRLCRENLKKLNASTEQFQQQNPFSTLFILQWSPLEKISEDMKFMEILGNDFKPVTPNCGYSYVSNNKDDWQWCCNLHGVLEGDKNLSFRYREHRMLAKINTKYLSIPEYDVHSKNLERWITYVPTVKERIIYNFNMNPITTSITAVLVVIGLIALIYKL